MEIRKDITLRFGFVYFSIALFAIIIVARIIIIQNVDTEKWIQKSKELKNNTSELWAKRGNICADDGSILSTSIPYYELRLDLLAPKIVEIFDKESEFVVNELSGFFGFPKDEFRARLKSAFATRKNRWFLIYPKQIDHNKFQEFKALKSMSNAYFGSGLIVITENKRILPHGDLASRTIGVLNKGAQGGLHGSVGFTGIEEIAENYLAGQNGLALKRNLSGSWISTPIREPREGKDVITTINVNLQDYAQTSLEKQMIESQAEWGTAIVMEVATGDIKAIANVGLKKDGTYGETYNFALGHAGSSEPGSTFKLMSLMVAMEEGYIDTSQIFDTGKGVWEYRKQKMYDSDYQHGGNGMINVKRIFEVSSNTGIAKIITKYFEGKEKQFMDRIYSYGLNKPLGIGFQGEAVPQIKYPTDADWWGPSLAWIAHGYEIKITPLQTLTFYNAVANNGVMVKPKFLKEIREDGIPVRKFNTEILNSSICSQKTLGFAQDMLKGVCSHGTGKSMKNPYYKIAGKTGTAVIANNDKGYSAGGVKKYQASFCGYFPADNPKYSIIVVIVGPKGKYYGGSVAGPVFRGIADKVYASYLEPSNDSIPPYKEVPFMKPGLGEDLPLFLSELKLKANTQNIPAQWFSASNDSATIYVNGINCSPDIIPEVLGMGASDAVYLLEKSGLKTKINGFGRVYRQSPQAGRQFVKGDLVMLDLGFDEIELIKKDSISNADSTNISTAIVSTKAIKSPDKKSKAATVKKVAKASGNKVIIQKQQKLNNQQL